MGGKTLAARFPEDDDVASDGKSLALTCPNALACLNDAINASPLQRKAIAADCGLSESQFSRLTSGVQGFPVALLDKLPSAIRLDFLERMQAREQHDVLALAAEQLTLAAVRWLRLARGAKKRMVKAGL